MMKGIMISIKPKWCELIASGEKTIEIRKTKPKIDTPFKCYIYCTNSGRPLVWGSPAPYYTDEKLTQTYGYSREDAEKIFGCWNGKVIGDFVCDEIIDFNQDDYNYPAYDISDDDLKRAYLHCEDMFIYGKGKTLYGWHISELKIYDEPKELTNFKVKDNYRIERCAARERVYNNPDFTNESLLKGAYYCNKYDDFCNNCLTKELTKPPQSWCYVDELR